MNQVLGLQKLATYTAGTGLTSNLSFACAVVSTISLFRCTGNPSK